MFILKIVMGEIAQFSGRTIGGRKRRLDENKSRFLTAVRQQRAAGFGMTAVTVERILLSVGKGRRVTGIIERKASGLPQRSRAT